METYLSGMAEKGIAALLIVGFLSVVFRVIKEYPAWKTMQNEHELKLKDMENSKEKEVATMMSTAMDKTADAINSLTEVVKGLIPMMERLDLRCEGNSHILSHLRMKSGLTAVKPAKFAKQERGESNG